MGYLNNQTITVDAILTKKGRALLSAGRQLDITKFAVSDDEIDYSLYDVAHPLGTAYYGSAIENMPILEASVDETQNMRYKLVSLPREQRATIPLLTGDFGAINLTFSNNNPGRTVNVDTAGEYDNTEGYTAILYDSSIADIVASDRPGTNFVGSTGTVPQFLGDSATPLTKVVIALNTFRVLPKSVSQISTTKLIIVGNESGATKTIDITVNPANTSSNT